MQVIIELPDDEYESIIYGGGSIDDWQIGLVLEAIDDGTPLTKGHGRIVDVGTIDLNQDEFISQSDYYEAECAIENAPTIIEADKEVDE